MAGFPLTQSEESDYGSDSSSATGEDETSRGWDGEYGESQIFPKSCGWDERREVLAPIERSQTTNGPRLKLRCRLPITHTTARKVETDTKMRCGSRLRTRN
jgi:hypothetical protein